LRLSEGPMRPTSADVRGACSGAIVRLLASGRGQLGGRVLDCLDDVDVARATAQVPGDRVPDLVLARPGVVLEVRVARHQHARGAVTALEPVLLHKPFLDRVEPAVLLEPLHRQDGPAVSLDPEDGARLHRPPVQEDGAGAAMRRVASDMRPGEAEHLPDQVNQEQSGLDVGLTPLAVDRDAHAHPDLLYRYLSLDGSRPTG